jgi:glycerol-3-phosphate acyltransferase PlsY
MLDVLLVVLAYLLGSVSTAVMVSKRFYGIDIREHGSGNAGATNTFRVLGKNAGVIVMIADILKGFLAVKLSIFSHYTWTSEPFVNLQVILGGSYISSLVWFSWRKGNCHAFWHDIGYSTTCSC